MGSNLESSSTSEVSETPEIETDNTQSAETDATSEDFEDCSVNEVSDSDESEACTDTSEDDEDYSDCSAQMETQEEVPEIQENDEEDFSDCSVSEYTKNTTDADHIEEAHFDEEPSDEDEELTEEDETPLETKEVTEEDEVSPETERVTEEGETPSETKEATEEDKVSLESEELAAEDEVSSETDETIEEDEVPPETEEIADENEIPPETEEVAEEDEIPPEMEETASEDEVSPQNEEVPDENEVLPATDEAAEEEGSDQTSENLTEENAESTADETDNSAEDAGENKKEEKENLEEAEKTTDEIEAEQAEMATQQERLPLQERIDKAFENEEVSADEINKLKEEHATELEAKVEERDAIEAQLKSKFDDVLSKDKGSEEYKQALQEYNALQDQKVVLDEQVAEMEEQQSLLEEKANRTNKEQQPDTEPKSLFGWFGRKQPEATETPTATFGNYEVDNHGFVKGENHESYIKYWEGYSADRYKTEMFDQAREQTISPSLVEGIRVSDNDIENPDIFWSQHEPGGTVESFEKIAANIPEVRDRLTAGEPLSVLMEDPRLGRCASIYFHPDSMPEVIKCGDYYEFQSNGRHRILAARNMGYDIPVKVIGERTIEDSGAVDPSELKIIPIEQTAQSQQDVWDEDKWGPDPFKSKDSSSFNIADTKEKVSIVNSLEETKDFDSLSSYMETKYGIQLDHSIKQLEFTTVKNAISGLESVVKEYPDVGNLLKESITSNSGVMSCSGDTLSFNPAYFSDKYTLTKVCNEQSAKKYWVPNASPETIGVHEAAHGIEWALIQANPQYTNDNERVAAWNNCDEAKKIVCEACNNLRQTPFGQTKNAIDHIRSISGYAMKDRSETMAEAFADVAANGEKAQPLSKEITRLTKVYMNKYKGGK